MAKFRFLASNKFRSSMIKHCHCMILIDIAWLCMIIHAYSYIMIPYNINLYKMVQKHSKAIILSTEWFCENLWKNAVLWISMNFLFLRYLDDPWWSLMYLSCRLRLYGWNWCTSRVPHWDTWWNNQVGVGDWNKRSLLPWPPFSIWTLSGHPPWNLGGWVRGAKT